MREGKMKKCLYAVPLVLLLGFTFACQSKGPATLSNADQAAIKKTADEGIAFMGSPTKDWSMIGKFYAEDAAAFLPNAPALKGREAILALLQAFPPILDYKQTRLEFEGFGNFAYDLEEWSITTKLSGTATSTDTGRLVWIWRKQADGSWKVWREMSSSDVAAPKIVGMPAPEAAIRQADEARAKAVASKSVEATCAFYDPEALTAGIMTPARGLDTVRRMWVESFAQKGFSLAWKVEKIVINESETIAYSSGTWKMAVPNETGPYLAVWRKQPDGQWKVLIDTAWYSGPQNKK
jgi:ketosteroid isomerase-like protein